MRVRTIRGLTRWQASMNAVLIIIIYRRKVSFLIANDVLWPTTTTSSSSSSSSGASFQTGKIIFQVILRGSSAPDKPYEGPKVAPQETADGLPENTFHYDENLKQWVDKSSSGAQPAAPEAPPLLAPPPTTAPGVDYYRMLVWRCSWGRTTKFSKVGMNNELFKMRIIV